jgi:hypothetical protein
MAHQSACGAELSPHVTLCLSFLTTFVERLNL